jgi:serine/threonine-protein kinase
MTETLLSPGAIIGSYQINHLIAIGGMGEVYLATHTTMGRKAAIKVIFPQLTRDEKFVERWRREARALAALHHPHIVDVYDAGVANGHYFIAMEYLPNGTLKSRLDDLRNKNAALPVAEALTVAQQMAQTLEYAHRNGIIHRDVKPSNILIAEDGRYVLSDFGIASHLGATRVTRDFSTLGSAEYMSPEQAQGLEISPRSDVYSLGVVVFEMLTSRLPFVADTVLALLYKHVNEPPPTITRLRADLPPGIKEVVNKALEKSPDKRYASAAEMANAIQGLLGRQRQAQGNGADSKRTPMPIIAAVAVVALVGSGVVIALGTRLRFGNPPMSTATPMPALTATQAQKAIAPPVATTTLAPETVAPSATTEPTATQTSLSPTSTSAFTPVATVTATATTLPTETPPPTATPAPTLTETPTATRTRRPLPTRTRTPVPTDTPVPAPTAPPQDPGGGGGDGGGGGGESPPTAAPAPPVEQPPTPAN